MAGNPINIGIGNKYEGAVDWRMQGGTSLSITRHYNSEGTLQVIDIGRNWRLDYDRSVLFDGMTAAHVQRGDGRLFLFRFNGSAWVGDSDVNDRLFQQLDNTGQRTGWTYYNAATDSTETYSASGRLTQIAERGGHFALFSYSDTNTPTVIAPGPGYLISVTDTFGRAISLTYSPTGEVAVIAAPDGSTYQYGYDASGRLVTVTAPGPTTRTYLYESEYNPNPNRIGALTGIIDENNVRYATYGYAATTGKAISTAHANGVGKYTLAGSPITVTDPIGTNRQYFITFPQGVAKPSLIFQPCSTAGCSGNTNDNASFDTNGNRTVYTDFKGNRSAYTYDLARNLETSRTEALNASGAATPQTRSILTTWHPTYRIPATITEPTTVGNKVTTFTHDPNGNVVSKSVAVASVTRVWSYTYDPFGRVLTATDPRNNTTINSYFPNDPAQGTNRGMLASVTNAAGHTTNITSYNAHGQPLSITDANGLTTTMGYDPRQRLTSRSVGTHSTGSGLSEKTSYEYDGVGQLSKVTLPDNTFLRYTYDGAHRLVEIKDGLNNRVVYTLDNIGNRIKEEYADPANALTRTRSRVYDALNRLQRDIGGVAGQVTQFAYDANGNQTGTTDPLSRTTTQSYDALNRLLEVIDPVNGSTAPTKYEYDP